MSIAQILTDTAKRTEERIEALLEIKQILEREYPQLVDGNPKLTELLKRANGQ